MTQHQNGNFQLISVAVDAGGSERVRPFVEQAGVTFPTLIDRNALLSHLFDFDVVPNGIFIDEMGTLRFIHIGGFSVRRPEHVAQIEALISAPVAAEVPITAYQERLDVELLRSEVAELPGDPALRLALAELLAQDDQHASAAEEFAQALKLDPSSSSAAFGLGMALRHLGRNSEALAAWKQALALDPASNVIRKQIWAFEHPERFYPSIDMNWQKEEIRLEAEGRTDLAPPPRS